MKKLLLFTEIFSAVSLFSLTLLPSPTQAQSCSSQAGTCTLVTALGACPNGAPITTASCFYGFTCCPNYTDSNSCQGLGGTCSLTPTNCSPLGSPLVSDNCVWPWSCCPNLGSEGSILCAVDGVAGVNTAIGCLKATDPKAFLSQILSWALGISGGIAFILILIAGFQLATSAGDPKRTKAAQELLTSALSGLVLIALSVVILNFLGVSVFGLNSLGFTV